MYPDDCPDISHLKMLLYQYSPPLLDLLKKVIESFIGGLSRCRQGLQKLKQPFSQALLSLACVSCVGGRCFPPFACSSFQRKNPPSLAAQNSMHSPFCACTHGFRFSTREPRWMHGSLLHPILHSLQLFLAKVSSDICTAIFHCPVISDLW